MSHPERPPVDDRLDALLRAAMRRAPDPPSDVDAVDADPEESPETVDDGALRAWRMGSLDAEGTAAIDAALADSPADRALARAVALGSTPDASLYAWAEAQRPQRAQPMSRTATRWPATRLLLAAAVLIAAGAALLLRRDAALPGYVAGDLSGFVQTVRGEGDGPGERPVFAPRSVIGVKLRPLEAREPPPVQGFVARPGGPLRAVPVQVTPAPGGALQVEFSPAALGAQYGDWQLYLALGEPEKSVAGRAFEAGGDEGAQWFEFAWRYAPVEEGP